jgi:hypothetical protein
VKILFAYSVIQCANKVTNGMSDVILYDDSLLVTIISPLYLLLIIIKLIIIIIIIMNFKLFQHKRQLYLKHDT